MKWLPGSPFGNSAVAANVATGSTPLLPVTFDCSVLMSSMLITDPVTDTYDVVLTAAPSDDVYVSVIPQPTRTLNADLAFDEDANFGENNEVQVRVATDRVVVALDGKATAGEVWSLILTEVDDSGSRPVPGTTTLRGALQPPDNLSRIHMSGSRGESELNCTTMGAHRGGLFRD